MNNKTVTASNALSRQTDPERNINAQTILGFKVSAALHERAVRYSEKSRDSAMRLVPAELVGCQVVTVPKSTQRQRQALITYAIEDRIATPIETVHVVQGPLKPAAPGSVLAFVVSRDVLTLFDDADAPVLPEFLMIPRPDAERGQSWSVWSERGRVVVRSSDGSGFAAAAEMLPVLWKQAGSPSLQSLGEPLGEALPARDLSAAPPPPDSIELAFSFARVRKPGTFGIGLWWMSLAAVAAALVLHVGLFKLDTTALRAIADAERDKAERAIAETLPGVKLDGDIAPILARLSPKPAGAPGSGFLSLLNDVTAALADLDPAVSFRRLAWQAEEDKLILLLQSGGLEDLQQVQQVLEAKRFAVRSGAANAGDGGAEVEMRISRGDDK